MEVLWFFLMFFFCATYQLALTGLSVDAHLTFNSMLSDSRSDHLAAFYLITP